MPGNSSRDKMDYRDGAESEQSRSVLIPLINFKFHNHPGHMKSGDGDTGTRFLGRKKELDRFVSTLISSTAKRGCFLVAGFRGAGKTAFVQRAIEDYLQKMRGPKVLDVRVNLGNDDDLQLRDILADMVFLLRKRLRSEYLSVRYSPVTWFARITLFISLLLILSTVDLQVLLGKDLPTFAQNQSQWLENARWTLFVWLLCMGGLAAWERFWSPLSMSRKLTALERDITSSRERLVSSGVDLLSFGEKRRRPPLSAREIETRLMRIIKSAAISRFKRKPLTNRQFEIIFIFDELDKIGVTSGFGELEQVPPQDADPDNFDAYRRKSRVEKLLGGLKNLVTASEARYIFIAGREVLDSFHSERASTSPLYESLFTATFYVPSFLTDGSDNQRTRLASMTESFLTRVLIATVEREDKSKVDDEEYPRLAGFQKILTEHLTGMNVKKSAGERAIENYLLALRNLVHYLTIRSWGNCKRLHGLLESYIYPYESYQEEFERGPLFALWNKRQNAIGIKDHEYTHILRLGSADLQAILLGSNAYILLHHRLSRRLSSSDDKLVVSTFYLINHIFKLHAHGFSRRDLDRVSEALDVHASPELSRIIDVILGDVLSPYLRVVRNSIHRYRFLSIYEQEVRHVTEVSAVEASAYNFSFDSEHAVKKHFEEWGKEEGQLERPASAPATHAEGQIILGNLAMWERNYDEAQRHYSAATTSLLEALELSGQSVDPTLLPMYINAVLARGMVEERRGSYDRAAALYARLVGMTTQRSIYDQELVSHSSLNLGVKNICLFQKFLEKGDSKVDSFNLAIWALRFLHLKRSSSSWREVIRELPVSSIEEGYVDNKPSAVYNLRLGTLKMFYNQFRESTECFAAVLQQADCLFELREWYAYLGAHASIRLALTSTMGFFKHYHREISQCPRRHLPDYFAVDLLAKAVNQFLNHDGGSAGVIVLQNWYWPFELFDKSLGSDKIVYRYRIETKFKNRVISAAKSGEPPDFRLYDTVALLAQAGKAFERVSLHTEAAHAQIGGIVMIGMVWELLPWRSLREGQCNSLAENGEFYWACVKNFALAAAKNLSRAHHMAFGHFQQTFRSRDLNGTPEKTVMVDPVEKIIRLLDGVEKSSDAEFEVKLERIFYELKGHAFWQHSPTGQWMVMTLFWFYRTLHHSKEPGSIGALPNIHEQLLPTLGIRTQSVMFLLAGRNRVRAIREQIDKKPHQRQYNHDEFMSETRKAVAHFYQSYVAIHRSSNNHRNLSFPPVALVLYNLWELLLIVLKVAAMDCGANPEARRIDIDCSRGLDDAINQLRVSLQSLGTERDEEVPIATYFFNYTVVKLRAEEALATMESFGDTNSSARRDVLYNKHFLDDDFEDTVFQFEWTYYQCFGPAAAAHREAMRANHFRLIDCVTQAGKANGACGYKCLEDEKCPTPLGEYA